MNMVDLTSPPQDMSSSFMDDSGYPRLTLDHVHLEKLGLLDGPQIGQVVHLSIIGTICDVGLHDGGDKATGHVCIKIMMAGAEDEGAEDEEAEEEAEGEEPSAHGNRYGSAE